MALACSSLTGMRMLEFDICAHSFPRSARRPTSVIRTRATLTYSLRLLQVRHEQAVRHALLKVPDHRRLACRDRDCQRLARSRPELDDIGPVALRAKDHDPVVASD